VTPARAVVRSTRGAERKKERAVNHEDFECYRMAFEYAQRHRFAKMGQRVDALHLVGPDGNIDPEFREMLVKVYRAVKQGKEAVERLEQEAEAAGV
jgi:hypothetical protein